MVLSGVSIFIFGFGLGQVTVVEGLDWLLPPGRSYTLVQI
jgi:hypothetical protein